MKLSDFRDLDPQNVGNWPQGVKMVFCVLLFAVIAFLGWYLKVRDQQAELKTQQSQEETLKREFSTKQQKAVNLEALRVQLDEMKDMLRQMLRQLPSKTEMPELLVDISQTALSSGIENELFQPGPEMIKEFYAEKPISLRMIGSYHQFGAFISGVASLPRVVILTMHDVSLRPQGKGPGQPAPKKDAPIQAGGILTLEGTVKTYRYVEDDESVTAPGTPGAPGTGTPATPAAGQKPAAGGG